jgi:hypothetical protein
MSSDSELEEELLQVAGQSRKKASAAKRKRRKVESDSDEEVSLDEESDWEEEYGGRCGRSASGDSSAAELGGIRHCFAPAPDSCST